MIDDGSNQSTGTMLTDALRASAAPVELELHSTSSPEQVARLLLMIVILILLIPAILSLTVMAIVVARGLGVPLYAPSRPPSTDMTKRS